LKKRIEFKGGSIKKFLKLLEQQLKPGEEAIILLDNPFIIEAFVKETIKTKIMVINGNELNNGRIELTIRLSEKNY